MTSLRPNFRRLTQPGIRKQSLRSTMRKPVVFKGKRKPLRCK